MLKIGSVAIFCFFVSLSLSAHDIKAALFRLYTSEGLYQIEMRLDRENMEAALGNTCSLKLSELSDLEKSALIEDYLRSNFEIKLNGEEEDYSLKSFSYLKEFLVVQAAFEETKIIQGLTKIEIVNTCLIDVVEDHDNIILVHLNDRVRSFRLNEKLKSTTIKY